MKSNLTVAQAEPKLEFTRRRIFGTETEFGNVEAYFIKLWDEYSNTNQFLRNGGRLYQDCDHIEYASPETRNPRDAVVWTKAGELIAKPFARKLFKNNVALDEEEDEEVITTFGAHENYFTSANFEEIRLALPFFVTRPIFAGSGLLDKRGRFHLSQRAPFLCGAFTQSPTISRGILDEFKGENHSDVPGWIRMHHSSGDANMCEVAEFLKLGATGLVLDLLEDRKLPKLDYNSDLGPQDITSVSRRGARTIIRGANPAANAIDVQRVYFEAVFDAYAGRDSGTDHLLTVWGDTLEKLADEPRDLFGRVDWVTKKVLIEEYAKRHRLDMTNPRLRNIDLQYHDCDPSTGLFYALQRAGKTERITTDEEIADAAENPPQDTRAKFRGAVVRTFRGYARGLAKPRSLGVRWDNIEYIYDIESGRFVNTESFFPQEIGDPFDTYDDAEQFEEVIKA